MTAWVPCEYQGCGKRSQSRAYIRVEVRAVQLGQGRYDNGTVEDRALWVCGSHTAAAIKRRLQRITMSAARAGEGVPPARCWAHIHPKDIAPAFPAGRCALPADDVQVRRSRIIATGLMIPLCRHHMHPGGPAWLVRELNQDRARAVDPYTAAVQETERELSASLLPRSTCPGCGCATGHPCLLQWLGNEAYCVPAGQLPGYSVCSACLTPEYRYRPPPFPGAHA